MSDEMAQVYGDLREVKRALFGDMMRQETGLVKTVAQVQRTADEIARQQGELMELVPLVQELKANSDARREREEEARRNHLSRAAMEVARIFVVLFFAAPVIAADVRPQWLGTNPLAGPAVLGGAAALFAFISILARRSE